MTYCNRVAPPPQRCGQVKKRAKILSVLTAALCWSLAAHAAEDVTIAPTASMNEAVLSVPGDPERPAKLVVTVLTPNGSGPFPLVVMNHGSNAGTKPSQEQRYRYTFSAYYFLSRGYAVVLPMMRGFAGSQGQQIQDGCNQAAIGVANAKDIRAVIEFMSAQPCMDGEHVVVAGQSFGGWNTLAFVTLHYPKVKALINFAGGANISECPLNDSALVHAAETYGAQTTIPSLWFYGDNDDIFAPPVWHAMLDHYTAAGGHAELVAFGRFMKNSHNMLGFREGLGIWAPKVDALLASVELPSSVTHPEYLPAEFPPPTMFAAIDNVDAVPYLTDGVRQTYRKFLTDPMPKVFVFSQTGLAASFNGGFDPLGRAMKACEERSQKCQVYAVDDYVAWARPTSAPPPTHFASITDLAAVPHLNDRGRQGYQKYLALRKPKAFVIAPDGGWFFASLGDDPLTNALRSCQNSHVGCQLYAVDDAVVWPGNPL